MTQQLPITTAPFATMLIGPILRTSRYRVKTMNKGKGVKTSNAKAGPGMVSTCSTSGVSVLFCIESVGSGVTSGEAVVLTVAVTDVGKVDV